MVGDQVIIDGEKQITAFHLNSRPGDPAVSAGNPVEVAWKTIDLMGSPVASRGNTGLARYTLTAYGDRVYARMGQPPSSMPMGNRGGFGLGAASTSFVVAVSRSGQGHLLWNREASEILLPRRKVEGGNRNAVFEGSPVADGRNVYVAITDRIEMTATYVVCLDAESGAPDGSATSARPTPTSTVPRRRPPRDRPPPADARRPDPVLPDQPRRRGLARRRDRGDPLAGDLPLAGPQRAGPPAASATSTRRSSMTAW